jgi:hypothetical protein
MLQREQQEYKLRGFSPQANYIQQEYEWKNITSR